MIVIVLLQSLSEAIENVAIEDETIPVIRTKFREQCPECSGSVAEEKRSLNKGLLTIYGLAGARQVLHQEYRCKNKSCRTGLFHGYRILRGGVKVFDDDCLANVCLGRFF